MQSYDSLIERIVRFSGLGKEELERRVEAKRAKLSGLISKEGAAQIIAAELGVSFENQDLKISELMAGMRKVNLVGKIINLFPIRTFEKNGKEGKVANLFIADDSGNCKVVLWDTNHIGLLEDERIKVGDSVEIKNASMRDMEVHLGGFSEFKKSDKVFNNVQTEKVTVEKSLDEIQQGQNVKIRAAVVQMFSPRFYKVCPECNKKISGDEGNYSCVEHGAIVPKEKAILNLVLDDGSETIRAVLFSDQINKLLPEIDLKNVEKLEKFRKDILGSEIYFSGNVRQNQFFNNLEIIGTDVAKVNVEKLIEILEKG